MGNRKMPSGGKINSILPCPIPAERFHSASKKPLVEQTKKTEAWFLLQNYLPGLTHKQYFPPESGGLESGYKLFPRNRSGDHFHNRVASGFVKFNYPHLPNPRNGSQGLTNIGDTAFTFQTRYSQLQLLQDFGFPIPGLLPGSNPRSTNNGAQEQEKEQLKKNCFHEILMALNKS